MHDSEVRVLDHSSSATHQPAIRSGFSLESLHVKQLNPDVHPSRKLPTNKLESAFTLSSDQSNGSV